jgi:probable rRNA maturation factor
VAERFDERRRHTFRLDPPRPRGDTDGMGKHSDNDGTITVSTTQRKVPLTPAFRAQIEKLARFVAGRERRRVVEIDIAIVGDRRMATLNERYLGHAGPTDALSFDLDAESPATVCAQIVVCADVAIRQATRHGHSPQNELLLYVTHALLHAMGYDDLAEADARRMHRREDALLKDFGVGAVFHA